ncbi:MAG: family 43 glycosylhydrolase, partial [Clostridia bacterium]|nr:family 43 glycosylhydrolase [Clostridia bacterium]
NGSFDININGGEFQHLVAMTGSASLAGNMKTSVTAGKDVDLEAAESGKISFTNYLRKNNADPFMFYHDGFYYYTATGGTSVSLIRVANIPDVQVAPSYVIFAPEDYTDLWSPEIHYFTADEIGEKNAGWYMFVGAKEKDAEGTVASNQRQYVLKCLDGDNLLGRWGDPVTGEVNVPRKMTFKNGGYNENTLCGGSSPIRIDGKLYITFVSEKGRGTSDFHQTINITTIENPWTVNGTPVEICRPDYSWEKGGYWYGANEEGVMTWWPQVVEGASAVYGKNGEVYLMYTGSGYWTVDYALGYLKLTGTNPLSKSSWTKNKNPVLRRVDNLTETSVNGSGHGSYFTDHTGQMWVAYHGYIGVDTSSKRFSFVEPIYVTSSGVSIGKKTGNPAPLDTVYNVSANPMSLEEKISGFNNLSVSVTSDLEEGVTVKYNPLDGASAYIVRRDGTLLYSGMSLSVVDTNATPGEHKYTVQAVKSGAILGSVTVYSVASNNLKFKDINKDGTLNIADVLLALDDFLNKQTLGVAFIDIVQMIKCV